MDLKLDGYKVVVLLLFTLIGLFLGVVFFTSLGVTVKLDEPIALITTAIQKLDLAINKLDLIIQNEAEVKAEQKIWRDLVVTDHLFISGLIAEHVAQQNATHGYVINGSDILFNDTKIPIPPSAHQFFTESFDENNTQSNSEGYSWPSPTSFKILTNR